MVCLIHNRLLVACERRFVRTWQILDDAMLKDGNPAIRLESRCIGCLVVCFSDILGTALSEPTPIEKARRPKANPLSLQPGCFGLDALLSNAFVRSIVITNFSCTLCFAILFCYLCFSLQRPLGGLCQATRTR